MIKRLLDYDPLTLTTTYHHYDPMTDMTHIQEVQDVGPYLEKCRKLANDTSYKRKGIKEDWYHFATVPNSILLELKTKHHLDYTKADDLPKIEKLLQREYKKLLTVDRI